MTTATHAPTDPAPERQRLRSAYLYLVCLVTLVMAVVGAVQTVRGAVELAYPDPGYYGLDHGPGGEELDPQERRRQQEAAQASQRRHAVLGLVGSGTLLLLAGPTYLYHWRRVQCEHAGTGRTAPSG